MANSHAVEDIVAVAVNLDNGDTRYFATGGRIFDSVDPSETERLVLKFANGNSLGGSPVSARVCYLLQDARERWQKDRAKDLRNGRAFYYLGLPRPAE